MKLGILCLAVCLAATAPAAAHTGPCMDECRTQGRQIRDPCLEDCDTTDEQCMEVCRLRFHYYLQSCKREFCKPVVTWETIPLIAPPDGIVLENNFDHIGMDGDGNIYTGWLYKMTDSTTGNQVKNTAFFKYNTADGSQEYLGNYIDALKAADNYVDGESVPKGHTHITFAGGRVYMGTQGFEDFKEGSTDGIDDIRGSHILSYDNVTGLIDMSKDFSDGETDGVATEHDGIVALSLYPYGNYLVGLSHPNGKIVLYDYVNNVIDRVVPGIPFGTVPGDPEAEEPTPRAHAISREIVVTPQGKVYLYRGTEDDYNRDLSFNIFEYDINSDTLKELDFKCSGGFWDGQTVTKDRRHVYISTVNGNLYHLDTNTEEWSFLGHMQPDERVRQEGELLYVYGLNLSPDEKYIYYLISASEDRDSIGFLYQFNVRNRKVFKVGEVESGRYTGNNIRDNNGNMYFIRFGGPQWWKWTGSPGLLKIHVE